LGRKTNVDMVEDGDDKDVEDRVPPANDNTRTVRLGHIRRPEDSHETIMLYHDSLPRNAYGCDSVGMEGRLLSERTSSSELLTGRDTSSGDSRVLFTSQLV
jgi:hypothetical protein